MGGAFNASVQYTTTTTESSNYYSSNNYNSQSNYNAPPSSQENNLQLRKFHLFESVPRYGKKHNLLFLVRPSLLQLDICNIALKFNKQ